MSAREKYRRPSVFAIFFGMLIGIASRFTLPHIRIPPVQIPDLIHHIRGFGPFQHLPPLGHLAPVRAFRQVWQYFPVSSIPAMRRTAIMRRVRAIHDITVPELTMPRVDWRSIRLPRLRIPPLTPQRARAFVTRLLTVPLWSVLLVGSLIIILLLAQFLPPLVTFARQQWASLTAGDTIYRVNVQNPPYTLDAQMANSPAETGHLRLIYEGLTRLNNRMETVPAAASSWSYSNDGLQVTFTLRDGLSYSDGSVLNALRFEYALLRAVDPRTGSNSAALLDGIAGAYALRTADAGMMSDAVLDELRGEVGIEARDMTGALCTSYAQTACRRLHITLTAPDYSFHKLMSHWIAYPVKEELIGAGEWYWEKNRLVGNGPFVLTNIDRTGHSDFSPNAHYWGMKPSFGLQFFYIADSGAALAAYQSGDLDILPLDEPSLTAALADSSLARDIRRQTGPNTFAVMMDATVAPFDDPKVRAAFAYAINREAFICEVLGGQGAPALTWIPQGLPGYSAEPRWGYNPALARQMLAESKYGGAAGLPAITVQYGDTPGSNVRWNWLKARWLDVLGVEIALDPLPPAPAYDTPLYLLGWTGDYADPASYLNYWKSDGLAARFHYANPAVDALLAQAAAEPDAGLRMEIYQQAQSTILDDVPAVMLYNNLNYYLFRPDLLPNGTPFDALFPVDADPAALVQVQESTYFPLVGK